MNSEKRCGGTPGKPGQVYIGFQLHEGDHYDPDQHYMDCPDCPDCAPKPEERWEGGQLDCETCGGSGDPQCPDCGMERPKPEADEAERLAHQVAEVFIGEPTDLGRGILENLCRPIAAALDVARDEGLRGFEDWCRDEFKAGRTKHWNGAGPPLVAYRKHLDALRRKT